MQEVYLGLYVGSQWDYEQYVQGKDGWAVVHACKEPYHRQALGYSGRGAPRNHPEYLVARRGNRLILNMVDADNPLFFQKKMIDQALGFVCEMRASSLHVLIHCNQGESRGPSIALLYLASRVRILPTDSLETAEQHFLELYPFYRPGLGIRGHMQKYWKEYCSA